MDKIDEIFGLLSERNLKTITAIAIIHLTGFCIVIMTDWPCFNSRPKTIRSHKFQKRRYVALSFL